MVTTDKGQVGRVVELLAEVQRLRGRLQLHELAQLDEGSGGTLSGSSIPTAEELAQFLHETYERLGPEHLSVEYEYKPVLWVDLPDPHRKLMVAVAEHVLTRLIGANRNATALYEMNWWTFSRERLDRYVYDVVRFLSADENYGLTESEIAPKIQDWADNSSGPAEIVYTAAARALAEPPPEDPTTLDRPEREMRRVGRGPEAPPPGGG